MTTASLSGALWYSSVISVPRFSVEALLGAHLKPGARLSTEISKETVVIEKYLAEGTQGEIYLASLGGRPVVVKWYKPGWIKLDSRLHTRLAATSRRDPPSPRFLWPEDIVAAADRSGFGYTMPYREARFCDFDLVISQQIQPSQRALANAGLQTAEGYLHLHAPGLCYIDVSAGNIALDPNSGEVRICDCDNVDVNGRGALAKILGTDGFMAPEIVQGEAYPNRQSDLWSLAVLLFWAFLRNHPLSGRMEYDCHVLTKADQCRLWGAEAKFIFDPNDASNGPVAGYNDAALALWPSYPDYIRELFTRAFTAGIHDPQQRVYENEWIEAMARLRDCIATCPCGVENFYDDTQPQHCWSCHKELELPRRLVLPDAIVVLEEGAALYPHHIDPRRIADSSAPVAFVLRHSNEHPDLLGLENGGTAPWQATLPNGEHCTVNPGACVRVHAGVRIVFGSTTADIV